MRENIIETYLIKQVEARKGITRKVTYQGRKGAPDRWCLFPGGRILLVECKAPGAKPFPLQAMEIETLRKLGFQVEVVDSLERVDEVLDGF